MRKPRDHRSGRRARKLAALVIIQILVLAGTAQANHGERTIDASPEDHTAFIGFSQQLTVTLSSAPTVADGTINVDFENEDGVNDTDGDTPTTPDKSCAIAAGNVSCSVGYAGLVRGSDLWRVWIDHDGLDSTFEADEVEAAADGEAANDTDVLDLFWEIGPPAMLDCDDSTGPDTERETNPAGRSDGGTLPGGNPPVVGGGDVSNETYTCRVFDSGRYPVSATVYGEVVTGVNDPDSATGASASYNTPDYQCTTDSANMCEILVTQNRSQKGTSQVCFWIVDAIPGSTTPPLDTPAKSCDGSGESLNEAQTTALDDPANDLADRVEIKWDLRVASGIDVEVDRSTGDLGSTLALTATIYDQFGDQFYGSNTANFEFLEGSPSDTDKNSPATADKSCVTPNTASCTVTISQATKSGSDLLCAWFGSAPTLAKGNLDGTCGGEGINDVDDASGVADPPEPVTDRIDVVQRAWFGSDSGVNLDCSPEKEGKPAGVEHEVACRATTAAGLAAPGTVVDAELTGANDKDGDSGATPDLSCVTAADGTCSLLTPEATAGAAALPGVTTYRAWIDSDNNDATHEADLSEGLDDAGKEPGDDPEPDGTDVVQVNWQGAPTIVEFDPDEGGASVGSCRPLTILVTDDAGQPADDVTLDVEQVHAFSQDWVDGNEPTVSFCEPGRGVNPAGVDLAQGDLGVPEESPDDPGTAGGRLRKPTDAEGLVTIGVAVSPTAKSDGSGAVTVTAYGDADANRDPDEKELKGSTTMTWVKPEARTIDCEDPRARPTGRRGTVTCTVRDRFGVPLAGQAVEFAVQGAGSLKGSASVATDDAGRARARVTSLAPGDQVVAATLGSDLEGPEPSDVDDCDRAAGEPFGAPAGNCSDATTMTWTQATPYSVKLVSARSRGSERSYRAKVVDRNGKPIAGAAVSWAEKGPGKFVKPDRFTNKKGFADAGLTSKRGGKAKLSVTTGACDEGGSCRARLVVRLKGKPRRAGRAL